MSCIAANSAELILLCVSGAVCLKGTIVRKPFYIILLVCYGLVLAQTSLLVPAATATMCTTGKFLFQELEVARLGRPKAV